MNPEHSWAAQTPTTVSAQNAEDQFRLGRAYERGEGVPQSDAIAGEWYLNAADQGNLKAMHNLGVLFLTGRGTPKDPIQGYRWIRKAADRGDAGSAYATGILLIKGEGVAKNTAEGVGWLRKAADTGDANALARLGQDTYFGDDGITKDPKAALPFIQAAAEKGNPWACGILGELLAEGTVLPKDTASANSLFQKGAQLGDPASQFEYARILMNSDPVKAYPWIKLALLGHEIRANGLMLECRPALTQQQITDGDTEAERIKLGYQPGVNTK
jgi:TPR repeat protein